MEYFTKRIMFDVIEDALTDIETPHGRGVAAGLCGAFYMCGLLSAEEWEAFLKRIPVDPCKASVGRMEGIKNSAAKVRSHLMN